MHPENSVQPNISVHPENSDAVLFILCAIKFQTFDLQLSKLKWEKEPSNRVGSQCGSLATE